MTDVLAIVGPRIFDGQRWHDDAALVLEGARVKAIVERTSLGPEIARVVLDSDMLVPGFVDLQVNGGGGVLFNQDPSHQAIATICAAHARFGTTSLLPTLITDTPEITARAVAAGLESHQAGQPGFMGLHLEGPHLSLARKGAHDPGLIRPMTAGDQARLAAAAKALPHLLLTVAAETVPPEQVAALAASGVRVSIGHSDAGYAHAMACADAGATMVTHLFNAMSPLGHREPGVVGAALDHGALWCGLIADGIHVHPAAIGAALRAKRGPGRLFLVTDAMSLTGWHEDSFTLNGRTITRAGGALRLADGTLAGADLTMIDAVAYMHETIGESLEESLRMASLYPAQAIGAARERGHLQPGARADFVCLGDRLDVQATFIAAQEVFSHEA